MLKWLTGTKLWPILAAIGLAALAVIKYLSARLSHVKQERDSLEAQLDYRDDVDEADEEIETDTDIRNQEIADAIESGKPIKSLETPNDW